MPCRYRVAALVSVCLVAFSGASFGAAKTASPVLIRPLRSAVSTPVRDMTQARPNPKDVHPAFWIRENEERPAPAVPPARFDHDAALSLERPGGAIPGPSLTFEGLGISDDPNGLAPPDTNGAVGPNHYLQMVNVVYRIWDKAGTPLTPPLQLSDLFATLGGLCSTNDNGDPVVMYDPLADRWILSQFGFTSLTSPPYHECVAISTTGDPTGTYTTYDFVLPGSEFPDYPKLGVWPDAYYMTTNQFFMGGGFDGAGAFAFNREKMLLGDPTAELIYFDLDLASHPEGIFGMLPATVDGLTPPPAGTPDTFMTMISDELGDPSDGVRLFEFHPDFATPANSTFTEKSESPLALASFDGGNPPGRGDIEQPPPAGAGDSLDSIASRLMHRLAYRVLAGGVQSYALNFTVNVSGAAPNGASTYQAGIRWAELRRDGASGIVSIHDQGTYAPGSGDGANGRNIWCGSIAQDYLGDIALGFSASSKVLFPSILYAGRLAGDPAGTLAQGEATMYAGTASQQGTSSRWGDYSAVSPDPEDDCTFWNSNEYYATSGSFSWHTRVGKFKVNAGCTAAPKGTIQGQLTICGSGTPIPGAIISTVEGFARVTDASGNYSGALAPGTYTVTATVPGYGTASGPAVVTDGGTAIVNLCVAPVPILGPSGATITAEGCAPNGVIDPGETVTVSFCIHNGGTADTADLVATLQSSGGVTNPDPPQDYGAVTAGGAAVCRDFAFTAGPVACGATLTATLALQDGATDLGTVTYDFVTGVLTTAMAENFDAVSAPALPAGWTATNASGGAPLWVTTTTNPDTALNDAFVDDPGSVSDKRLTSPAIALSTASGRLSFRSSYDLEAGFDGGVLEIAIDGGAFADILTAGGSFVSNGYNGTIGSGFGSPLAGRSVWTGSSAGYVTTVVNLPASAAGHSIALRWRMGSDSSVAGTGWRIDTIGVTDGFVCCSLPAVALQVDAHATSTTPAGAPVNGVWEPGETVVVEPAYSNPGAAPLALTGTATSLTGPPGATYTIADNGADYGTIAPSAASDCYGATGNCYRVTVDNPGTRPAAHWDATLAETLSPTGTKTWTLHIGDSFPDVPTSQQFYRFIEDIFHNGITGGCGGGNYCPDNSVTRAQMAVFLLKSKHGSAYTPPACTGVFPDVACPSQFADWIEELFAEGITGGCGGGNYCPGNPVTRAQMAVFLLKASHGSSFTPPACAGVFPDVACPSQFADWIEELFAEGITGGCGGGNYCPSNPNTRGQMAVFLTKTFGLLLYGP